MPIELVAIATELVFCDFQLLVLFSDGSYKQYAYGWNNGTQHWNDLTCICKYMTHEQIAKEVRRRDEYRMAEANANLHESKVRRYGWDYAQRGY